MAKKLVMVVFVSVFLLSSAGLASAFSFIDDTSNPDNEWDLYGIFNFIYNTSYTSSDALFIERGLADSVDNLWYETNGHIDLTVRYAGYGQELGILDNNGYLSLATNIPSELQYTDIDFITNGNFVFVETLSGSGSGAWYSDDRNSSTVDHFMAFITHLLIDDRVIS